MCLMSSQYIVVYTPLFKQCLGRLKRFVAAKESSMAANKMQRAVEQLFDANFNDKALKQEACDRLVDLGINKFQQITVQKNQSVFYKVEDKLIVVLAIVDKRQSITDLLYDSIMRY